MILFLKACFLGSFLNFQSFANKILNSFQQLRNRYEAIIKHLEEILIYGLEEEVLYHKHLNLLQQFFQLLIPLFNLFH